VLPGWCGIAAQGERHCHDLTDRWDKGSIYTLPLSHNGLLRPLDTQTNAKAPSSLSLVSIEAPKLSSTSLRFPIQSLREKRLQTWLENKSTCSPSLRALGSQFSRCIYYSWSFAPSRLGVARGACQLVWQPWEVCNHPNHLVKHSSSQGFTSLTWERDRVAKLKP
jgi:hypothetical protein